MPTGWSSIHLGDVLTPGMGRSCSFVGGLQCPVSLGFGMPRSCLMVRGSRYSEGVFSTGIEHLILCPVLGCSHYSDALFV